MLRARRPARHCGAGGPRPLPLTPRPPSRGGGTRACALGGACPAGVGRARCAARAPPTRPGVLFSCGGCAPTPPLVLASEVSCADPAPSPGGERVGVRGLARRCSRLEGLLRPRGFMPGGSRSGGLRPLPLTPRPPPPGGREPDPSLPSFRRKPESRLAGGAASSVDCCALGGTCPASAGVAGCARSPSPPALPRQGGGSRIAPRGLLRPRKLRVGVWGLRPHGRGRGAQPRIPLRAGGRARAALRGIPRAHDTTTRVLVRDGGVGGCAPHSRSACYGKRSSSAPRTISRAEPSPRS